MLLGSVFTLTNKPTHKSCLGRFPSFPHPKAQPYMSSSDLRSFSCPNTIVFLPLAQSQLRLAFQKSPTLSIVMLCDSNKAEAQCKGRCGKSSLGRDLMQNSGYHTDKTHEFPTIEEWVAKKDEFRVVGLGHTRPFPLVSKVSSNTKLVSYHQEHVGPHLSRILTNHKIPWDSI